tara:strand:+ start:250 stop:666 length:417 start_codon:yes stop_codon:yes gene_type:complete
MSPQNKTIRPISFAGLPKHALSIRQPWCHRILHAGKDVENRNWPTRYRGPVLIHAGKAWDDGKPPEADQVHMPRGGIVGVVEIIDCVSSMDSEWFCGPFGFVLRNAQPLPFRPCRGQLGFFACDYALLPDKEGGLLDV